MADGIKLMTHVYFPKGDGPWPVLLTRNPYPSSTASLGEIARIFTRYGYAVVVREVFPNGKTYNIRDGITSLAYRNGATAPQTYKVGKVINVSIETWPITWTIKKGSRIRLDVSSSNFPAYMPHSNFAGPWALQKDVKIANQNIYMGKKHKSYIEIPTDS
jgi:predicted acyl esterase